MQTGNRIKALLIAVVVVGWGAIGTNIYLNFFKKSSSRPSTTVLDFTASRMNHLPR